MPVSQRSDIILVYEYKRLTWEIGTAFLRAMKLMEFYKRVPIYHAIARPDPKVFLGWNAQILGLHGHIFRAWNG